MPARPEPFDVATLAPLLDADGASLATLTADGASLADAEGVTLLPSGDALVSFEREHRVLRYAAPEYVGARGTSVGVEQWVRTCDSVIEGFGNAGIEAVQALNASHVVVACEHPPSEGALHGVRRDTTPVRVLDIRAPPALARTLHYPIEDGWGVVDFALLAPGTLLVLERTYVSGWGNAIRLRRLGLADGADGTLLAPELLLELRSDVHVGIDNFEGLACLPTSNGTARVFMVSDNNFHPNQRTLLLEFELPANARPINATAVPPPAPGVSPGAAFGIAAAALVGGAALAALVICCRARQAAARSGDKAALARRPTADIRAAVSQMQLAEVRGLRPFSVCDVYRSTIGTRIRMRERTSHGRSSKGVSGRTRPRGGERAHTLRRRPTGLRPRPRSSRRSPRSRRHRRRPVRPLGVRAFVLEGHRHPRAQLGVGAADGRCARPPPSRHHRGARASDCVTACARPDVDDAGEQQHGEAERRELHRHLLVAAADES